MRLRPVLVLAPTCASLIAAQQETADPLEIFASEALSVYTEATSILASVVSAATAVVTSSSSYVDASSTSSSLQLSSTSESSPAVSEDSRETTLTSTSSQQSPSVTSKAVSLGDSQVSSSVASPTSSSVTISSLIFPSSPLKTSSVLGAASAETGTSTAPSTSKSHDHDSKLPIILGCVLGALALGMAILMVVLCRKRRRHGQSPRHRALSPGDDEVESWRLHQPSTLAGTRDPPRQVTCAPGAAPLMSDHPAFRNSVEHDNPFVPAVPPPRRTAPNARAGLTDGMVPGDDPFLTEKEVGVPASSRSRLSTGKSRSPSTLAAVLAIAAAKEDLQHHQKESQRDASWDEKRISEVERPYRISRKPVPVNHVNSGEPWPYSPVSPIDQETEAGGLVNIPATHEIGEHRRSFSRDAARANAAFDKEYTSPDAKHEHEQGGGLSGLAPEAIGGPGLTYHHNHPFSANGRHSPRRSQSPQRPAVGPLHGEDSKQSSTSSSSSTSQAYHENANPMTTNDTPSSSSRSISRSPERADTSINQPQQEPYQYPSTSTSTPTSTPPSRNARRNSATPISSSTALVHPNRPAVPSPLSSEIRRDRSHSPGPAPPPAPASGSGSPRGGPSNGTTNKSNHNPPRRTGAGGGSAGSRYSYGYSHMQSYDDPSASHSHSHSHYDPDASTIDVTSMPGTENGPPYDPVYVPDDITSLQSNWGKGIIGDSRYPDMDNDMRGPRRRSAGVERPRNTMSTDISMVAQHRNDGGGNGNATATATGKRNTAPSRFGDDSAWRLSSGMPAGWQRQKIGGDASPSPRPNTGAARPRDSGGVGFGLRDSGVSGISGRRRLRASDFAMDHDASSGHGYVGSSVGQAL